MGASVLEEGAMGIAAAILGVDLLNENLEIALLPYLMAAKYKKRPAISNDAPRPHAVPTDGIHSREP
jgi:hypothetical protein